MKPLCVFIVHPSPLLTDHLPHGDGLTAFGFIQKLAERGHRLHVAVEAADIRAALPENVTLYQIRKRIKFPFLCRLEYMVRCRLLFERLRREGRIDLLHQLNPVVAGLSLSFAGIGLPLILGTYVGRWPDSKQNTLARTSSRIVSEFLRKMICNMQQRAADALLITTPAALSTISHSSSVRRKVHVLPQGFDRFELATEKVESGSTESITPSILYLANVWRRKGIFDLLHAFPIVHQSLSETRLVIGGEGSEIVQAQAFANSLPCRENITFLGNIPRAEVPLLLGKHTVYCLPSHGEPFGRTVIEAMGAGRPIVATNAGAFPYLVEHHGGRLVAPGNTPALASALIEVLSSPELQHSMGEYNRHKFEVTFAWEPVIVALERIYEKSLE